jgi:two-component system sensor histidine kinase AlgZ
MSDDETADSDQIGHQTTAGYYLPDLNNPQAVLGMLLSIELFVGSLALMRFPIGSSEFLNFFAGLSFLMLWVGIVFALTMHFMQNWLRKRDVRVSTAIQLICLVAIAAFMTYLARIVVFSYLSHTTLAVLLRENPQQLYVNNILISLLVGGLLLRYFYIAHQNQETIKAISAAQVQALQSRIRPHFLFNSLNSIASLIRIDPELAEQSVEDLSDLFRASLAESAKRVSLKEELEIARLYQRIEQLRLGDRLKVKWKMGNLPLRQKVPVLIVQPLLENAIYHGIEPLTDGGTVNIFADVTGPEEKQTVEITIKNPLANNPDGEQVGTGRKHGNQIAMKNIEQRLRLVYGDGARVIVNKTDNDYQVTLRFPCESDE